MAKDLIRIRHNGNTYLPYRVERFDRAFLWFGEWKELANYEDYSSAENYVKSYAERKRSQQRAQERQKKEQRDAAMKAGVVKVFDVQQLLKGEVEA